MLLRSMQQAIYTAHQRGHFGLAYEAYTHFTSPIRRYPDLLVHRVIKALLAASRTHRDGAGRRRTLRAPGSQAGPPRVGKPNSGRALERIAAPTSVVPTRPRATSKPGSSAGIMRDRLGEEFSGTVTAATTFGLFVQLDAVTWRAWCTSPSLAASTTATTRRQELRGERTGVRYGAGSRLRVQVSRVDLDGRRIEFRIFRGQDPARPNPRQAGKSAPSSHPPSSASDQLRHVQEDERQVKRQRAELAKAVKAARTDGARKAARADAPPKGAAKKRR
jgi:ribonuclease R